MRNAKILAAMSLAAMVGVAQADVSGTAAIVSDYDFRGLTQTDNNATVQLSIDYGHESGWYIGGWGSGVDFGNAGKPSTQLNAYTGYQGSAADVGYDLGIIYRAFPGASDLSFAEIYGKLSYSIVSGGVYYSNDFGGSSDSAFYVYGDVDVPAGPVVLNLHAGRSDGDGVGSTYFVGTRDAYTDYSVGVSYSANNLTLGLKWVGVDAGSVGSDDRVVLSVSTALPWK